MLPAIWHHLPRFDPATVYAPGTLFHAVRDWADDDYNRFCPEYMQTTELSAALVFVREFHMPVEIRVETPATMAEAA